MSDWPHALERTILIRARRSTVFRYFTDTARFADWWGRGSSIDGRAGGAVRIRYPNGVTARGEILELAPDERVVFTYGYDDPSKPIPPGGSRVTVTFTELQEGTRVSLRHEMADSTTRDQHVAGWRYQLAVFANVVAREAHADAAARIDRFFALWSEADALARSAALGELTCEDVGFRDAYGCINDRAELVEHLAAIQAFMPGAKLARTGEVRQCQGVALADWTATDKDGAERGHGTSVFEFAGDGRIRWIVGIWS